MHNDNKGIQKINRYFKKFISSNKRSAYFEEPEATIIKNMEQLDEVPFDSDWNYLMTLVQLIESMYCHHGFISDRNYFRFDIPKDRSVQDKGPTKMEAIYSCCYQALNENWKEGIAPPFNRGGEPFDLYDINSE